MAGPNAGLLMQIAQGGRPQMADAFARGAQQGNALLQAQQQQQDRQSLADIAGVFGSQGPDAAYKRAGELGQFQPAVGLYDGIQDRAYKQDKLNQPGSAFGKLWADEQAGLVPPGTTQRKIAAIGTGGTNVTINNPGNIPLGKKPTNDVTGDVVSGRVEQVGLANIRKNYDPSFLTYRGQLEGAATRIGEKAGLGEFIPKQNVANLKKQTQFKQAVQQTFNRYRKDITGAAAAVQELEQLKKALFNLDQSPTEFEAALDAYESTAQRLDELRIKMLQNGIDPTTPEGGKAFDDAFFGTAQPAPSAPATINGYTIEEVPQ